MHCRDNSALKPRVPIAEVQALEIDDNKQLSNAALLSLGKTMYAIDTMDASAERCLLAGYTYLGQFIDHDILFSEEIHVTSTVVDNGENDDSSQDITVPAIEATNEGFESRLNLSSVYGKAQLGKHGISQDGFLAYRIMTQNSHETIDGANIAQRIENDLSLPWDLPKNDQGVLIPDTRNSENWLIAQLHTVFLKLHNVLHIKNLKEHCASRSAEAIFNITRLQCLGIYRTIVRDDYLKAILDIHVYNVFFGTHTTDFNRIVNDNNKISLPFSNEKDFSVAAFRLGHSMVADSYTIANDNNQNITLSLLEMMSLVKSSTSDSDRFNKKVNWQKFFHSYERSNMANCIYPRINIPVPHNHGDLSNLAIRNLLRGKQQKRLNFTAFSNNLTTFIGKVVNTAESAGSSSGLRKTLNDIIKHVKFDNENRHLINPRVTITSGHSTHFTSLLDHTKYADEIRQCPPLWYGILCEACAINSNEQYTNTLGPIGSWIVAEHFKIKLDDISGNYVETSHLQIKSMQELISFVSQDQGESDDL